MDQARSCPKFESIVEIMKGKLYFAVTYSDKFQVLKNDQENFYFNIDEEYVYMNYYMDFGPLNISCLYKYCLKLQSYMQCSQIKRIIHYTCSDPNKRVNSAYLLGSYCVVYLNMDPICLYRKLMEGSGPFRFIISQSRNIFSIFEFHRHFVDASQGVSRYTLKLLECLQGIHKASLLNFFNFQDFSVAEYDLYDKIQNGDFNWLVPRKFLALIGPIDKEISPNGHSPSFYIKYFLRNDVKTVVRLNNKLYDPYVFSKAGIDHYDLFFPDGTPPPKPVLLKFLQIAEKTPGAIAVHCKAGLGRTGSLIGAYIMKHYQFTAKEAIAWMRICRPGSVIGQQQAWLEKIEPWLWKEGKVYRYQTFGDGDKVPHHKYGVYSKQWQIQRKKILLMQNKRTLSEGPGLRGMSEQEVYRFKQYNSMYKNNNNNNSNKYQQEHQEENKENNVTTRKLRMQCSLGERTQGDKLNEIKMKKYLSTSTTNNPSCDNRFHHSNHSNAEHGGAFLSQHNNNNNSNGRASVKNSATNNNNGGGNCMMHLHHQTKNARGQHSGLLSRSGARLMKPNYYVVGNN